MFNLAGRQFQLEKIGLMRAACPVELQFTEHNRSLDCSIVVIKNKAKLGYVDATKYTPPAVMISGRRYREMLLEQGVVKTWAFVEAGAIDSNKNTTCSCSSYLQMIRSMFEKKVIGMLASTTPGMRVPAIVSVFPFENYFVHTEGSNRLRGQQFRIDPVTGVISMTASWAVVSAAEAKQAMLPVQTGVRHAVAPPMGNTQSSTTGAPGSELVTEVIRNVSNIAQAVSAYLIYTRTRVNRTPMRPAFSPVALTPDNKIAVALAAAGIEDAYDFVVWAAAQQEVSAGGPGSGRHAGAATAAYAQTDLAKKASEASKGHPKDDQEYINNERAAYRAHAKAEKMHDAVADQATKTGDTALANQHRGAAEEHSEWAGAHQDAMKQAMSMRNDMRPRVRK